MTNSTAALDCTEWEKQMKNKCLTTQRKEGRLAAVHPTTQKLSVWYIQMLHLQETSKGLQRKD